MSTPVCPPVECDPSVDHSPLTKLTQVQTEVGSLHQAGVLTHGPNVEVHEDGQACERGHAQPHQEEQVGQEHQLEAQTRSILVNFFSRVVLFYFI